MEDKISVIMCSYNTEKYIKRAIDSVLNQTYKNIELIIVDDSSTDQTFNIISKIDDNKIICLRNEINSGAAFSRNKALEVATGDYIGFVDSDDSIPENYYEILLNKIKQDNADIAVCDIKSIFEENNEYIISKCGSNKGLKSDFINNGLAASSCNKLFKKDLFAGVSYPVGKTTEDVAVILPILYKAKKITYTLDVYYNYFQRSNSVQNTKFNFKKFDIFDTVDLCNRKIDDNDIKESIVFNQIILLLFYSITKEKKFFSRLKILKSYHLKSKKYNLKNNKYYISFLNNQGIYHKLYYKFLLETVDKNLCFLSNLIISFYYLYQKIMVKNVIEKAPKLDDLIILAKKQKNKKSKYSISVVIPNYNYSNFLYERLYSILYQTEKINEIIILDDASKDDSREKIEEIELALNKYINIRSIFNETNSGSAFKQWEKGFNLSKSNYVWIAEADDYSSKYFLKNVMKQTKKNDVVLSYCDTAFIDSKGKIIHRSVKKEIDLLNTGHWNNDYVIDGKDEIKEYAYLNCTIANVSSVVLRKDDYGLIFKEAGNFKQAGDWFFYLNVMMKGKVSYSSKTLNYYRIHGSNVTSTTKKQSHFLEIIKIHNYLKNLFRFTDIQEKNVKERQEYLKDIWDLK